MAVTARPTPIVAGIVPTAENSPASGSKKEKRQREGRERGKLRHERWKRDGRAVRKKGGRSAGLDAEEKREGGGQKREEKGPACDVDKKGEDPPSP